MTDKRRQRGIAYNDAEWEEIKGAAAASTERSVADYLLTAHRAMATPARIESQREDLAAALDGIEAEVRGINKKLDVVVRAVEREV